MTVTLVTGSARGLGLAAAQRLHEQGDRVHVVWRSSTERVAELEQQFRPERVHRADVEVASDVAALIQIVVDLDGALDRVVHAVGTYVSGPASEVGVDVAEQLWRSNVLSAQLVFDAARPHLRRSESASAVFFGAAGLAGHRARRTTAQYAAAKSALLVLVRSWALEEAPFGVTVNMVSPGHTPHDGAHADTLDPTLQARLPMKRAGTPGEVADAVAWLVSPASRSTTGTDLSVSGGWLL